MRLGGGGPGSLRADTLWAVFVRRVAVWLILTAVAAGCGSDGGAVPDPPPIEDLILRSADAMSAVDTARFEMSRSGAPVSVSWLEFDSAIGVYRAPDEAKAVLRGKAADVTVEAGTISIGDVSWLANPLTGTWDFFPPDVAFNPATVFDDDVGWRAVLLDLGEAAYGGPADEGGEGRWVVTGVIPPERIATLTVGLVESQEVPVEMMIDPATFLLRRVEFSTVGADGASDWVITLSEFGEPVSIEPPDVE